MSSDPVISPPVTAEIKVRAVYDQGRDEYPLLEIEEVEGIDNMAHLVELLWYAIRSCDEVSEDPQMDAIYPERRGGKVTIQFRDGTSQNRCVEIPRGEPENFPAPDLHQSKFLSLH